MSRRSLFRRLGRDARGATIIEFAIILPVLSLMLMGTFDLGYRSYVTSIVQGSLHEASRMATVGNVSMSAIETHVEGRLQEFSRNAEIEIDTASYANFSEVSVGEPLTTDAGRLNVYDQATDCYRDLNNSGKYTHQVNNGTGGAEDVVRFQVRMTYPRLFPMASLLGWSDDVEIVQETMLRNQPYAGRATSTATIRCRTAED
ncbi:MAG TPA: TadE/TadG family type IV pilus assembly protein [Allosphingosinicella sp.]|nr:TadE/TadG family type IV pilus assembly protein [Allosphingosinicella sp.]